ncbi:MAG: ATP-dependent sacrificial sulfur transferase LarE [Thermoplasmatota archaeon]
MKAYQKLVRSIRTRERLAVAYSGGVDSSVVALAAREALGDRSLALMANIPTITEEEIETARLAADEIGIELRLVKVGVLDNEEMASNPSDRCGTCKKEIMSSLMDEAIRDGFHEIADGSMPEDQKDYRPGLRAADELGVWHPLMDVGMEKREARMVLKERGISVYNSPSTTCLATRIPYGERITEEKLSIIADVERKVRKIGFRDVRLRLYTISDGSFLGIMEVDDPLGAMEEWDTIEGYGKGIKMVLDPKGYRQGAMNEGLSNP